MEQAPPVTPSAIEQVRRINRTWIVHGHLDRNTENYLAALEQVDPAALDAACVRALAAARKSSREQRDPKPDFYAELFRDATAADRATYLHDHPWTRALSAKLRDRRGS